MRSSFEEPSGTAFVLAARGSPKLLRAQALETYGRRVEDKTDEPRQRALLSDLLRAAAEVRGMVRHGIGAGWLVELRASRFRGSALVAEGQVVHVAVL